MCHALQASRPVAWPQGLNRPQPLQSPAQLYSPQHKSLCWAAPCDCPASRLRPGHLQVPNGSPAPPEIAKGRLMNCFAQREWQPRHTPAAQIRNLQQARLAQSAERKALNLVVVGSSPTVGAMCAMHCRQVDLCSGHKVSTDLSLHTLPPNSILRDTHRSAGPHPATAPQAACSRGACMCPTDSMLLRRSLRGRLMN